MNGAEGTESGLAKGRNVWVLVFGSFASLAAIWLSKTGQRKAWEGVREQVKLDNDRERRGGLGGGSRCQAAALEDTASTLTTFVGGVIVSIRHGEAVGGAWNLQLERDQGSALP